VAPLPKEVVAVAVDPLEAGVSRAGHVDLAEAGAADKGLASENKRLPVWVSL